MITKQLNEFWESASRTVKSHIPWLLEINSDPQNPINLRSKRRQRQWCSRMLTKQASMETGSQFLVARSRKDSDDVKERGPNRRSLPAMLSSMYDTKVALGHQLKAALILPLCRYHPDGGLGSVLGRITCVTLMAIIPFRQLLRPGFLSLPHVFSSGQSKSESWWQHRSLIFSLSLSPLLLLHLSLYIYL